MSHLGFVAADDVFKVYGPTRALAGVSARFDAGTVTVVEGPNGAGKSSLLTLLALLATPTSGQIRFGADGTRAGDVRRRIGLLAHASMLYPDLTGRENLALFAELHGLDAGPAVRLATERFGLGGFLDRPVRTRSRGQLQRLALARALLHAPDLLLLDEPSTGLDRSSIDLLVDSIGRVCEDGAIVVAVSHDEAFSARVATHVLRLERGRVVERRATRDRIVTADPTGPTVAPTPADASAPSERVDGPAVEPGAVATHAVGPRGRRRGDGPA